ncbi:MAG TPA: LamG domain-containing protein [Verrucomicrobiota bacterium]|nr:LamG domain-containing protein [Verrucomicrobiota bacterium]
MAQVSASFRRRLRVSSIVLLVLCLLSGIASLAQVTLLNVDYRNLWLNTTNLSGSSYSNYFGIWPTQALTNASTAVFGGSVYDNSTNLQPILPVGGNYGLISSSLGQPVEGIRSDVSLGQAISSPRETDTNRPPANFVARAWGDNQAAYYESPDGGAFWSPSTKRVIAAQPNNVLIEWLRTDGSTNTQVLNISAVPGKRPARLFWTEKPYDAPPVNLKGFFPVIHYNSEIPPPVYQISTNVVGNIEVYTTNVVSGVWLDNQNGLHATRVSGMFLIEYYKTGTFTEQVQPEAIEVVQVLAPDIRVQTADVGSHLLPRDSYWAAVSGPNGVIPNVTRGMNETVLVYPQDGPKLNWAFSIRRTWQEPWSLEIYWQHRGIMGVLWPYEADWYSCDWPASPQLFVIGDNANVDQAPVLIPPALAARVLPDMDPPFHASIDTSGRSFSTISAGFCLLQYTTHSNIWFDVVQTVSHTNTAYFDLQPFAGLIGTELTPAEDPAHALWFDAEGEFVDIATSYLNRLAQWSLSVWFSSQQLQSGTVYSEGTADTPAFVLSLMPSGQIQVAAFNGERSDPWTTFTTTKSWIQSNQWHNVTLTYTGGSDQGGTLQVIVDKYAEQTTNFPRVNLAGASQAWIGAEVGSQPSNFFLGKVDRLRIWDIPLTPDQVAQDQSDTVPAAVDLLARYDCDEGQGSIIYNQGGDNDGTLVGDIGWAYGQLVPTKEWLGFPGYIHMAEGNRYNVGTYNYPTVRDPHSESYIFGVNSGLLEVWWANRSRNADMPPVYYPSQVIRYTNTWPTLSREIVIASGLGSDGVQPTNAPPWDPRTAFSPSLYLQNDPAQAGYNPNEEHALILDEVVYALRNDLNGPNTSEPFVLVDYFDGSGRPKMAPFQVVTTNALYQLQRSMTAGNAITPIMPLAVFPPTTRTSSDTTPPAWRDRNLDWWAVAAGNDGHTTNAIMRFYYHMLPTFNFPSLSLSEQPPIGTELPWLPEFPLLNITSGTPIAFGYEVSWPTDVPVLHLGQTLTTPTRGLPDVWDQLSVDVVYQQSEELPSQRVSVDLFDPIVAQGVDLAPQVIDAMLAARQARTDLTSGLVRFPNLPPSLYPRLYYDRNAGLQGQLMLKGQAVETLTGSGYLLLNLLQDFEQTQTIAQVSTNDPHFSAWSAAVTALPQVLTPIQPNLPFVNAALTARLSDGVGYVTVAFNNSTNRQQVPPGLPVSLSILQVDTNLYSGDLEVIEPADALAEQLSLRFSADFAGKSSLVEFRWRYVEPLGGLIPNTNFLTQWFPYGVDPMPATNEVTITGTSPFTLTDHFFAVQYRPLSTNGPSGTNWSAWAYNLAPGWVVRAMSGINPFNQVVADMINNPVDPALTMISLAGGPYEGDIALNLASARTAGLIPTYETIFHRAKEFTLSAGVSGDPAINQTLLYAATRLNDLYMLLGNEAFADAQDPTIAFPHSLTGDGNNYVGSAATSIFAFMNQVPNLLEEELALLRGRDDTLNPPINTTPIYNRLIWNFTQGINGGEAAYAYNYQIRGDPSSTTGVITAADAKRIHPQGHGDAWGHYLSAISHYYGLLAYTNFWWQTEPGATLLGNTAVSTDFLDEQKFAEAAAARARTGAQIVQLTFRQRYSEDPTGRWSEYHDSNTNRAWGIGDWASRAGQAAYYDWAVANSLMLNSLTNLAQLGTNYLNRPPEGIEMIDRISTPELSEISASFTGIQRSVDSADSGLNPLGFAQGVVPFDIDPKGIDQGQTHFEQAYARALKAVQNACISYDRARGATLMLREEYESMFELIINMSAVETDYHNRLIAIYGYPYEDDIGPAGTYPQGYDGPDLINWQILDLENLLTNAPLGQPMIVPIYNLNFTAADLGGGNVNDPYAWDRQDYLSNPHAIQFSTNSVGTVTVYVADNGLKVKPPTWTGRRRAQGELQLALSDLIRAWYSLEGQMDKYSQTMLRLNLQLQQRAADVELYLPEYDHRVDNQELKLSITRAIEGLKITGDILNLLTAAAKEAGFLFSKISPVTTQGVAGPFPVAELTESPGVLAQIAIVGATYSRFIGNLSYDSAASGVRILQTHSDTDLAELLAGNQYFTLLRSNLASTVWDLRSQDVALAELLAQVQALEQSYERVQKLLAQGEQLIYQRGQIRSRAAQRVQRVRYGDLGFRLFRNDALRRYQDSFDLAARYTYLAAQAYDYETGLLSSDSGSTSGREFLANVARARLPGRFYSWLGDPVVLDVPGEPGLADILARMQADWNVVKGRFGFNNPDTETSRFSLRTELFRISPDAAGDAAWAQVLEDHLVPDLKQLPDYVRFCRPLENSTNPQPAIVLSFPTYIRSGINFFGQALAGGDNSYNPTHAATKIRSAGVWFTGYNTTFNPEETGPGLANGPQVYLVPAGTDLMRSPTADGALRSWTVLNQAMPLPFNISGADIDAPDWSPIVNSLPEPFAQIRKLASIRAYHDSGNFDPAETINNSRLVGRSVWNTRWLLIVPGSTLLSDPVEGLQRFIYGAFDGANRDHNGVKDIKIFFQTYSISGE